MLLPILTTKFKKIQPSKLKFLFSGHLANNSLEAPNYIKLYQKMLLTKAGSKFKLKCSTVYKLLIYCARHYLLIVCEQDLQIHLLGSILKRNCKDNYHFQLSLGPSILLYNPQLV